MPDIELQADYRRQTERLAEAVRAGGALALRTFGGTLRSWIKGGNSPVCEADIAVNELLHARLHDDGIGWLSEESVDDPQRLRTRRVWVIDPIDGTRAYMAGLPDWTVAAALVEDGRPVAAAVFAPVEDELFAATRGQGATCNGVPIAVAAGDALDGAKLSGPRSYLERLQQRSPGIVLAPRVRSLALRITRVAQGTLDAAMASSNSHDWDLAAADLLVHEAGGLLTTLAGQRLRYNRPEPVHEPLLAAGRDRHALLLGLLQDRRVAFI